MFKMLGIYAGVESEMFTAGELFTALALFNQLAVCLSVFPVTVPIFIKGFVSRNRIKTFLDKQEAVGTYIDLDTSNQVDEDERLIKEEDEEEPEKVNECPIIKTTHILRLTDASFAWQKGCENVLHDLNLTIPNGDLTVIIGSQTIRCHFYFFLSNNRSLWQWKNIIIVCNFKRDDSNIWDKRTGLY